MESGGDSRVLGVQELDPTMTDIGERLRPPGEPPDETGSGSWAEKVRGYKRRGYADAREFTG